jgi:hypothetical protein
MVPVVLVSAVVGAAVDAGAVPVSLAVSANSASVAGGTFQISADRLEGTGFSQYAGVDRGQDGVSYAEGVSGITSADLYGLCQSIANRVPAIGHVTVRITAGGGGKPAHADNLVVDTHDLRGDAVFHNITVGGPAGGLGGTAHGSAGMVGQQADRISISHLKQVARSVTAATFRLRGLHLSVKRGDGACF